MQANSTPKRQPSRAVLEVFHGTRKHGAALLQVSVPEAPERRGEEGRERKKALYSATAIWSDIGNERSPWAFGVRSFR